METAGFMAESVEKIFHLSEQVISSVLWCSGDIVKVGALGGGGGALHTCPGLHGHRLRVWQSHSGSPCIY